MSDQMKLVSNSPKSLETRTLLLLSVSGSQFYERLVKVANWRLALEGITFFKSQYSDIRNRMRIVFVVAPRVKV